MNNHDKARKFLEFREAGDARCEMLIFMLAMAFRISEKQVLEKIRLLAEEKEAA